MTSRASERSKPRQLCLYCNCRPERKSSAFCTTRCAARYGEEKARRREGKLDRPAEGFMPISRRDLDRYLREHWKEAERAIHSALFGDQSVYIVEVYRALFESGAAENRGPDYVPSLNADDWATRDRLGSS